MTARDIILRDLAAGYGVEDIAHKRGQRPAYIRRVITELRREGQMPVLYARMVEEMGLRQGEREAKHNYSLKQARAHTARARARLNAKLLGGRYTRGGLSHGAPTTVTADTPEQAWAGLAAMDALAWPEVVSASDRERDKLDSAARNRLWWASYRRGAIYRRAARHG